MSSKSPHAKQQLVECGVSGEPAVRDDLFSFHLPGRVDLEEAFEKGPRAFNFLQGPAHHFKALSGKVDGEFREVVLLSAVIAAVLPTVRVGHT